MMYEEMKVKLEEQRALHKQTAEMQRQAWAMHSETDIKLRYILSSGLRIIVSNLSGEHDAFNQDGGRPWTEEYPAGHLIVGHLTATDLRELLEIRLTIDEWRRGGYDLPIPPDFMPWDRPMGRFQAP